MVRMPAPATFVVAITPRDNPTVLPIFLAPGEPPEGKPLSCVAHPARARKFATVSDAVSHVETLRDRFAGYTAEVRGYSALESEETDGR